MQLNVMSISCMMQLNLMSISCMMQLVKKLVDRKLEPRTALMLPAMVYAHLVLLDMANVKGKNHIQ